ncbi:MAG: hypothetical protein ABFS42_09345 [Candidatus Krumholzibacteriota bacterium]
MRFKVLAILVILNLGIGFSVHAADPTVRKVVLAQRTDGSGLVDISYTLFDADGDTAAVTLQLSDDGGATWDFPVMFVTGDVGPQVVPGKDRNIVWDAGAYVRELVLDNVAARVVASDAGVEFPPHSPRHVAITDFTAVDWADPAAIEKFSRADLCLVMGHHLWMGGGSENVDAVRQLKALNPDLVILAYVSVKSAQLWGETANPRSFWYKWFHRTTPYFVYTTLGEIGMDWPTSRLINILEPGCRQVMIETIMEMQAGSLNVFDGVYWDYFNTVLWVSPDIENEGDPDMDNDGIGHWDDTDEMVAYRAAQIELVNATRDSLGEGFIQFFNGQRAYADSSFASLADGAYYELFPTLFFPDPDMQHALDPGWTFSLFNVRPWFRTVNGGPYIVLASTWYTAFRDDTDVLTPIITGDKFRAIALLGDFYASWNSGESGQGSLVYGWSSHDISLGQPLGPAVFAPPFIRRDFQYGQVEIEMTGGRYPDPFDYRIWLQGNLVSELAIPRHTP